MMIRLHHLIALAIVTSSCGGSDEPARSGDLTAAQVRFELGVATADDARSVVEANIRRSQQAIAKCMGEAGFDYVAAEPGTQYMLSPRFDMSAEKFASAYGYGVSKSPGAAAGGPSGEDPNLAIYEALSPSAQAEYDRALYGDPGTGSVGGCTADAQALAADQQAIDLGSVKLTRDELVAGDEQYQSDLATWRDCAGDLGILAESPEALIAAFQRRYEAAIADPAALGVLQEDEVQTATVLLPCDQALSDAKRAYAQRVAD